VFRKLLANLEVTMEKDLNYFRDEPCHLCNGSGKIQVKGKHTCAEEEEECPICDGKGNLHVMLR
jgi:DnaJ-class molecular chaperone